MLSHTLYLEYLVLVGTIAPAELIRVATSFGGLSETRSAKLLRNPSLGVPGAYVLVAMLALAVVVSAHVRLGYLTSWKTSWLWLVIATGIGVTVVAMEAFVGALLAMMRGSRAFQFGVSVHARQVNAGFLAAIVLTAVAEEVLYRGIWIGTFTERLHVPYGIAIGGAAFAYALGHMFFGATMVAQKMATGVVFGVLLVASGSVLVPLVAHVVQNVTVFGIAARQVKEP